MGKDKSIAASYARQFAEVEGALPGRGLAWLDALRANAIERFAELDFPTPKLESWKFTNLRPLTREVFAPSPATRNGLGKEDIARWLADDLPCHLMVFVDGHFRADLSELGALPRGRASTASPRRSPATRRGSRRISPELARLRATPRSRSTPRSWPTAR